jgi:hypothetical protein
MATTVTLKPNAIDLSGSTSGTTTLQATAVAGTTTLTLPAATDILVGKATTDTLTNKTLTSPVISTISNTGTLTLPTSTDTLVGRATTDTLTNKTLTSPTLTTPNINSAQFATVSGTAPIYPCRAWVNFNGSGTPAIRGSGNVSSITDNGTGDYTINFTTAMPDTNYSLAGTAGNNSTSMSVVMQPINLAPPGTTTVRIQTPSADGVLIADPVLICVNVFR